MLGQLALRPAQELETRDESRERRDGGQGRVHGAGSAGDLRRAQIGRLWRLPRGEKGG